MKLSADSPPCVGGALGSCECKRGRNGQSTKRSGHVARCKAPSEPSQARKLTVANGAYEYRGMAPNFCELTNLSREMAGCLAPWCSHFGGSFGDGLCGLCTTTAMMGIILVSSLYNILFFFSSTPPPF